MTPPSGPWLSRRCRDAVAAPSISVLDAVLVDLVLDLEFERHGSTPSPFPAVEARTLLAVEDEPFRSVLRSVPSTMHVWEHRMEFDRDAVRQVGRSLSPRTSWKPAGGLWTSPLRGDGSSPWGRYIEVVAPYRPTVHRQIFEGPTDALNFGTLADFDVLLSRSSSHPPLTNEWWRQLSTNVEAIQFSWHAVLASALEPPGSRLDLSLSVPTTFWLRPPRVVP